MDAEGLPIVSPPIDWRSVEALASGRLLCFINHFVAHTVDFLNRFAVSCETKLNEVNVRIQRTKATLSVLEAKLDSVPGLDHVDDPKENLIRSDEGAGTTTTTRTTMRTNPPEDLGTDAIEQTISNPEVDPATETGRIRAKEHPSYGRYFKMVQLGVPLAAVKLKFVTENPNLDPETLDDPDAFVESIDSEEEWSD